MIANVGFLLLLVALACAAYAAAMALLSVWQQQPAWLESAHRAAVLTWPLVSLSCLALIVLLVTDHYEIGYVASVSSISTPLYLKITALWAGQAGSLLFWAWLMATFSGLALLRNWDRDRALLPYVIAVMMVTLGFFLGLVVSYENPFARLWQTMNGDSVTAMLQPAGMLALVPPDGQGLNPLLRHPGMVLHPPMLYAGFVSFVVPYSFAIAALAARRTDDEWIRITRRWTLVGWLFLSLGLILGGRWAYDVLGWGGYWSWDPVENAAFMPWLTATAFLHSVMIQEKRGMLKKWNMSLIILTYALVIFGTFLTRSGVLSSVHAFAESAIGPAFFVFIVLTFVVSLTLLFGEWDRLKSDTVLDSLFSRESAFLLNNLLFMTIAASVFWGTVYPMIDELLTGTRISIGAPFFNRVTGPQFAALVLLMGICPLLAWRQASARRMGRLAVLPAALTAVFVIGLVVTGMSNGAALLGLGIAAFVTVTTVTEIALGVRARLKTAGTHHESPWTALISLIDRNRRRYGGYTIHLGVVVMAVGIIGSNLFQQQTQGLLHQGEQMVLGPYMVTYKGLDDFKVDNGEREVTRATLAVYRSGTYLGDLHPRRDLYVATGEPVTIAGVQSSVQDDLYVILADWEQTTASSATFKIYLNPLINWVWTGGIIFIVGTLVAAWPKKDD